MNQKMSQTSKEEYLDLMRRRYKRLTGKHAKTVLLNEFCEVTGHERKYGMKLLNGNRCGKGIGRGGRTRTYGKAESELLHQIWRRCEMPCGKRLKGMLPEWVPSYVEMYGDPGKDVLERIGQMSASTIDRLLKDYKFSSGRHRGLPPKNAAVKAAIEVRAERWDAQDIGWMEADTVALCGGNMGGSFMWALSCTDILSGWTEVRGIWNCGAHATCTGLENIEENLPFALKGMDTDNGSEFLNWHVVGHYQNREVEVKQTRSRPYRKNDQAHIEQKNYTHVRQLLGYERYGHEELLEAVNGLLKYWSLWKNLFHVTMRQEACRREGARRIRRHEKEAKTPYQRLIDSKQLSSEMSEEWRELKGNLNPFEMGEVIESWQGWINEKSEKLDKALAVGKSPTAMARLVGTCPWLRYAQPDTSPSSPRHSGEIKTKYQPRKECATVSSIMRQPDQGSPAA